MNPAKLGKAGFSEPSELISLGFVVLATNPANLAKT